MLKIWFKTKKLLKMNIINQKFNQIKEKMRKIIKTTKVFDIDFSFVFVFVIAYFLGEFKLYFWYIVFLLGHELSHFFVAKRLGYYPKKIKLNFFGAVLEGDDDFALRDEIKVVLAGPFFNFCVIVFCYLSFWFEPETFEFLNDILLANWALLLFNMLPIFPLDAGRLILLRLTAKQTRVKAIKTAKIISILFVFALFVLFLLSSFYTFTFSLGTTAVNLMFLVLSNSEDTSYKRQLFVSRKFKLLEKGLLERTIYVKDSVSIYSLFKFIDDQHYNRFVFLNSNYRQVNSLDEVDFYRKIGML